MRENTQYLIFIDLLGFEELAKEIAQDVVDPEEVRVKLISTIENILTNLEDDEIAYKTQVGGDSWVLVTNDYMKLIKSISEILNHHTPYPKYRQIPLEVAVGVGAFDEWAILKGRDIIVHDETIEFLKTNIIGEYHKWYKENNDSSVKSTFILLTESMYNEMDHLNEKWWNNSPLEINNESKNLHFCVADVDKVQKRAKYLEFLRKVGFDGNKVYDKIDSLYVPPIEFDEIKEALDKDRFVFITGTPEYGKTYTAVRLLWEYFDKGYNPKWILGNENTQRIESRKLLVDIESQLKRQSIIYFEDPFGKTRYEKLESLERDIAAILDVIHNFEDVYVIITSREEIFKEFLSNHLSSVELEKFEKKINIKKPSYNYDLRKKIFFNWAREKKCKWIDCPEEKKAILESLRSGYLPTPLSIKQFCIATVNERGIINLKTAIEQKSKETSRNFAGEIKNMSKDKILFLSFPFISSYFKVEFVKNIYYEMVGELELIPYWDFDELLNWFKEDKIEIYGDQIRYSHPSYYESFESLLFEKGRFPPIYYEIFPNLLLKLVGREEALEAVSWNVLKYFGLLPEDIRNSILLKSVEYKEISEAIMLVVESNFTNLPENLKSHLLLKLAEHDEFATNIIFIIISNFNSLPPNVQGILFNFAENTGTAESIGVAEDIVEAVEFNFFCLPEDIRNKLLSKLAENDEASESVVCVIAEKFDYLPHDLQNLLSKFAENAETAIYVAGAVAANFEELPSSVQNLLFKLAENTDTSGHVAEAVNENFFHLPEKVRNRLLSKLAECGIISESFILLLVEKYDYLSTDLQKLLFMLAEKADYVGYISKAISANIDYLPESVSNKILKLINE